MTARRFVSALAAVVVAGLTVLVPTSPAAAAPRVCTVDEWRNPFNFTSCVDGIRKDLSARVNCLNAPAPGSPDSGMAGWFASRPDSSLRPGVPGRYSDYGVAGYPVKMYDVATLVCEAGPVFEPTNTGLNAAAEMEFWAAAALIGGANGLREKAYEPGGMWAWADSLVAQMTGVVYRYVFNPVGGVVLLLVGLLLVWQSRRGQVSEAVRTGGWALFVLIAVTGVAQWPVAATHLADNTAAGGLGLMHSVVGPVPQNVPADKCVSVDPEACRDHRSTATRASDTAVESILYRNWLFAMLGSADSPVAKQYGPVLYDATAVSWDDAKNGDQSAGMRKLTLDTKADQWRQVAEKIKDEDPQAYEHLRGVNGKDRLAAGAVALISALIFTIFDVAMSVIIMLGFLIIRYAVVLAPVVGTIGILRPASGPIRQVGNMTLIAIINIVVAGTGSGIFLMSHDFITRSPFPDLFKVSGTALAAVVLWMMTRPLRRLRQVHGRPIANGFGDLTDTARVAVHRRVDEVRAGYAAGRAPGNTEQGAPPRVEGAAARPEAAAAPPRRHTAPPNAGSTETRPRRPEAAALNSRPGTTLVSGRTPRS